jgi:hypothetical protein
MVVEINDMFRLVEVVNPYQCRFWVLQEWEPSPYREQGRWKPVTKRMDAQQTDRMLERMQCPSDAQARFRAAAGVAYPVTPAQSA